MIDEKKLIEWLEEEKVEIKPMTRDQPYPTPIGIIINNDLIDKVIKKIKEMAGGD